MQKNAGQIKVYRNISSVLKQRFELIFNMFKNYHAHTL